MLLQSLWTLFEEVVFTTPSTDDLFNPYRDRHEAYDHPEAPAIRRENLHNYLACYSEPPRLLLLAEAPGPWGCRFSGVPLVSESQLADPAFPISGEGTSLQDVPHKEYSASIYWQKLLPYFPDFFTWNSVPFHPHQPGKPLSIRNPRRSEVAACEEMLAGLVACLQPERTIAVGRKAERALHEIDAPCTYVRHPSQGGANLFRSGVQTILNDMGMAST